MTSKRRKKKRVYTLADLRAIAEQLGGRVNLQIVPLEMLAPPEKEASDTGADDEAQDATSSHRL